MPAPVEAAVRASDNFPGPAGQPLSEEIGEQGGFYRYGDPAGHDAN
jgi:hypothetical protein